MLNNLKTAIRKKKLYFILESSRSNIDKLYILLVNNIISGFYTRVKKKKTFLLAFINYTYNFKPTIFSISKLSNKLTLQKNVNVKVDNLGSNFIMNINIDANNKKKDFRYPIKFR